MNGSDTATTIIRPERQSRRLRALQHPIAAAESQKLLCYVGAHHKTGVVWMYRMFRSIASRLGLPFLSVIPDPDPRFHLVLAPARRATRSALLESVLQTIRDRPRGFVFDRYSMFAEVPVRLPQVAGMHLVRDPRDVLISATFYHLGSAEPWLHESRTEFGGMTYQQKLRAAPTLRAALMFELRHQTGLVIREMAGFPASPNVRTVTYESLMSGDVLGAFEDLFSSLGFAPAPKRVALSRAHDHSVILNPERRPRHVRSGSPQQWRDTLDRVIGEEFAEHSGDELIALGYEADHSWIDELPHARPALDEALPTAK